MVHASPVAYSSTTAEASVPTPDIYEQIHKAEAGLANCLDTKNWDNLHNFMTQDVVYDNSAFGPGKGAVSTGLDQVITNTKNAFGDSMVSHSVTTALINFYNATSAHVITYLIFSKWDPTSLTDGNKTYRVYEKCDDNFVLDQGLWKLKYSKVTDMAPKFEQPYFGQ
ncbi:hypothetical protein K432DRAFT_303008 [Lepidopterella palustris CBS 459.81]|uniref:SnoaL-like domain-containing protein n=1 Tax=Lepidopterella palustris CBS 459.81 TaxID=1314670 RepID=A0A8E2JCX1_9PEZI|nr:hypothetical protein K432DRAFT_303008 [Lepidopterella palustris CBS 459.81]